MRWFVITSISPTIKSSGESLLVDLDLRGGELAGRLQQSGDRVAGMLTSHSSAMTEQVRESAEHVAGINVFYRGLPASIRGAWYACLSFVLMMGMSNEPRQFLYFQF